MEDGVVASVLVDHLPQQRRNHRMLFRCRVLDVHHALPGEAAIREVDQTLLDRVLRQTVHAIRLYSVLGQLQLIGIALSIGRVGHQLRLAPIPLATPLRIEAHAEIVHQPQPLFRVQLHIHRADDHRFDRSRHHCCAHHQRKHIGQRPPPGVPGKDSDALAQQDGDRRDHRLRLDQVGQTAQQPDSDRLRDAVAAIPPRIDCNHQDRQPQHGAVRIRHQVPRGAADQHKIEQPRAQRTEVRRFPVFLQQVARELPDQCANADVDDALHQNQHDHEPLDARLAVRNRANGAQDGAIEHRQNEVVRATRKVILREILKLTARVRHGGLHHREHVPHGGKVRVIADERLQQKGEHGQHGNKPPARTGQCLLDSRAARPSDRPDAEPAQTDAQQCQRLVAQQIATRIRLEIIVHKPVDKDDDERHSQHQQRVDAEDKFSPVLPRSCLLFHRYSTPVFLLLIICPCAAGAHRTAPAG